MRRRRERRRRRRQHTKKDKKKKKKKKNNKTKKKKLCKPSNKQSETPAFLPQHELLPVRFLPEAWCC